MAKFSIKETMTRISIWETMTRTSIKETMAKVMTAMQKEEENWSRLLYRRLFR